MAASPDTEADFSGSGAWAADSIVLAEALVSIEEVLGIEVPMDAETAQALRSADTLATYLSTLLGNSDDD